MIRITILLCAVVNQVTSQTNDVFPAKILGHQKTLSVNSDLFLTCSTFGFKKQNIVYVYLCKDGIVMKKQTQKRDQNDTTFTIHRVSLQHSGNYSCVYSKNDYSLSKVIKSGHSMIHILVIANFVPAHISLAGLSTVSEGGDVEFRCAVSDTLQTLGGCRLILAYLMRNERILQVRAFNVTRLEAAFTIEGAAMRDSGHYSCVVLPSRCIQEHEKRLYGSNTVLLEVKGRLFVQVFFSLGVIILMMSLGLGLWYIKAGNAALCNQSAASHLANTVVLEEQQEQTEGEDLEAQDGDSFSIEDESEYEDDEECEPVYDVVHENENGYDDINQIDAT